MPTVALVACVEPDSAVGPELCSKLADDSMSTCARHPDWCTVIGCSEFRGGAASNGYTCPTATALADDGAVRRAGRACERAGGLWVGPDDEYWDGWDEHGLCDSAEWDAMVICDASEPVAPNE
jgi:hypothetical protein